jgi:hypothetical protein
MERFWSRQKNGNTQVIEKVDIEARRSGQTMLKFSNLLIERNQEQSFCSRGGLSQGQPHGEDQR